MTLLIFDCDGVLVDSEMIAHAAMAELMSALSRPMTTQEALGIFAGRRLRDALAAAEALLSAPIPHDVGVAAGQRLLERFRRELKPVEGVRQAIEALPYARCVASSSTPERLRVSLDVTGLAPLFGDNVFSAD
ncbi:MAG TPA: HAD family hydrolase, partial [Bradyrhizobium sp.]